MSTAHDVVVVDRVPTSMTPLGAGGTPLTGDGVVVPDGGLWDASDRTITWTIASLPAGPPVVLDYDVQVADPVVSPATFTNTVTATTTSLAGAAAGERVSGGTNPARYADTSTVTLAGPRPSVTKSADVESAPVGATVTYTVTAVVPPSVTTFDATVLDTLPAGLAYVRTVSAACTTPSPCDVVATPLPADGQRLGWFLGDLAPVGGRAPGADRLRGDRRRRRGGGGRRRADQLGTDRLQRRRRGRHAHDTARRSRVRRDECARDRPDHRGRAGSDAHQGSEQRVGAGVRATGRAG